MPKKKGQEKVDVSSEIIDGLYTIKIEDIGLTLTQLQEKIKSGKIKTFTDKQKEYISQLIVKGFVQEMFKLKGIDFTIGFRTINVIGAQNALIALKDIQNELKSVDKNEDLPESYINNTLQVLFVSKYLSKYGDKFDQAGQSQDDFERVDSILTRYNFIKTLPGLVVDSLYGKIQEFNNIIASSIAMDNIENF